MASEKKYKEYCQQNYNNPKCTPTLRGILKFSLGLEVNTECQKCQLLYLNGGECKGKTGSVPCLLFKENTTIDFDTKALDQLCDNAAKKVMKG